MLKNTLAYYRHLLSVDGNFGHPLGRVITDVLHDELQNELEQLVHVVGGHHGDVAPVLGVDIVRTSLPPVAKVKIFLKLVCFSIVSILSLLYLGAGKIS